MNKKTVLLIAIVIFAQFAIFLALIIINSIYQVSEIPDVDVYLRAQFWILTPVSFLVGLVFPMILLTELKNNVINKYIAFVLIGYTVIDLLIKVIVGVEPNPVAQLILLSTYTLAILSLIVIVLKERKLKHIQLYLGALLISAIYRLILIIGGINIYDSPMMTFRIASNISVIINVTILILSIVVIIHESKTPVIETEQF